MLRVLHIGKYYPPFHGGIENFLRDLAECQLAQGDVEPSVLVHQHQVGRAEETETANDVFVRRVRIIGRAVFTPLAPLFLRSLNQTIEERDPDILHLHLPNPSTFWCLFSRSARRRPWVIHWHSDVLGREASFSLRCLYPVYQIFERALLHKAKRIIVTSPPYLETSVPLKSVRQKCSVVPLGIPELSDTKEMSPEKTSDPNYDDIKNLGAKIWDFDETSKFQVPSKSECKLKVLCVGRLTYYKGHSILVEAIARNPNIEAWLVGEGEEKRSLLNLIEARKLTNRFFVLGSMTHSKLAEAFSQCDLVCLPSIERTEAFGLVLAEAARAGKPSLVTNVGGSGMSWVVREGFTGWVVKAGSISDLSKTLGQIAENKAELYYRGTLARQRYEELFRIDAVTQSITGLYSNIHKRS